MVDQQAPDGFGWVSCSVREYGMGGRDIHLISDAQRKREHWQTTVCGATANLRGIWRRPPKNSPKALCKDCLAEFEPKKKGRRR